MTWEWAEEENLAFERLYIILSSQPVLAQWDPNQQTVLEADYSGYAFGGGLSQINERKKTRPIEFFSQGLNSTEANYPICEKEMHGKATFLRELLAELKLVLRDIKYTNSAHIHSHDRIYIFLCLINYVGSPNYIVRKCYLVICLPASTNPLDYTHE